MELKKRILNRDGSVRIKALWHEKALYHDHQQRKFINPLAADRVSINFQTEQDAVQEVILHYYDNEAKQVQLTKTITFDGYDIYNAIIEVEALDFKYLFEVRKEDYIPIWYGVNGSFEVEWEGFREQEEGIFVLEEAADSHPLEVFEYSFSTEDIFETPDWVQDAIFYQIFPDRFYNGNPDNDPEKVELYEDRGVRCEALSPDWKKGVPDCQSKIIECETQLIDDDNFIEAGAGHYVFYGGDLQGIEKKIPYLKKLGINTVYLNPIFKATSNHKYNTAAYELIDDTLAIKGDFEASEQYFRSLIKKLHENGIRIIIDAVFNHTGYEHWAFQDIVEKGEDSEYTDWYLIHSFPVIPIHEQSKDNPPNYESWWGFGSLPKLNVKNPEVKEYLFEITAKWMDPDGDGDPSDGVDGWRLDVPNELEPIDPEFWLDWRQHVKDINPEAYITGEIWDDAASYLQGDKFDAVMNYCFRDAVVDFIAHDKENSYQFANRLARTYFDYPEQAHYVLQNLLDSHDTARFLTVAGGDKRRLKLAVLLKMTYVGAPMIYYGSEVGMQGAKDPDCRRTMLWEDRGYTKPDQELFAYYQKLIKLRKEEVALRRGSFKQLDLGHHQVYAFERSYQEQRLLIVLNAGLEAIELDFKIEAAAGEYQDLVRDELVKVEGGRMFLSLAELSGLLIKLN
ncbi:glycoside hydrolase family 13 protein [Fuchsiella alkaliacetigena]|uniref:glycoside hydrolase family 13 protein n=1 Tax=Fuchsiella alkaliacetigena TaxID=957042 RepID=UPI00200A69AF|nr:glycoside hydrolase family 13 protein [Fuchsiella alkaliacetigena]MCK8824196.1 glycoside hydrolase family 13 protein [Fuchsiella alkaliacetigena]